MVSFPVAVSAKGCMSPLVKGKILDLTPNGHIEYEVKPSVGKGGSTKEARFFII